MPDRRRDDDVELSARGDRGGDLGRVPRMRGRRGPQLELDVERAAGEHIPELRVDDPIAGRDQRTILGLGEDVGHAGRAAVAVSGDVERAGTRERVCADHDQVLAAARRIDRDLDVAARLRVATGAEQRAHSATQRTEHGDSHVVVILRRRHHVERHRRGRRSRDPDRIDPAPGRARLAEHALTDVQGRGDIPGDARSGEHLVRGEGDLGLRRIGGAIRGSAGGTEYSESRQTPGGA